MDQKKTISEYCVIASVDAVWLIALRGLSAHLLQYQRIPPRIQSVLSLVPFKTPILGKCLANTSLLVNMLCSLKRSVCFCAIAMITADIHVDELLPTPSPKNCELYCPELCVFLLITVC